ncbi:DUF2852 domain-containing protein [Phaeobacter italicus]|uniref:DUF2852 domain-containing protein n=1 Tax=Phaeobacter italicus TaxID=481446 RepID=UPI000619DF38|nr:DUF2852 domain-containing protein [Phaeobacter italicus]MCI5101038.1 DUF2852 domain-containing protein [Phaeobacter italicus]
MTSYTSTAPHPSEQGWFSRTEAWLDHKGKGAWIAAMVLGFVFFWPVGLALLFYMIWSKRMFSKSCRRRTSWTRHGMSAMKSSGNSAFDAYKADTLRRLEQEQNDFEAFLERLRAAKDKSEFDQFMDERALKADEDTRLDEDDSDDEGPRGGKRH